MALPLGALAGAGTIIAGTSTIGGLGTGAGFGLAYGASLSAGYAYGQTQYWRAIARANALKYLYEQVYKVYTDYYVQSARYSIGLKSQFG